mgnify:FL=1
MKIKKFNESSETGKDDIVDAFSKLGDDYTVQVFSYSKSNPNRFLIVIYTDLDMNWIPFVRGLINMDTLDGLIEWSEKYKYLTSTIKESLDRVNPETLFDIKFGVDPDTWEEYIDDFNPIDPYRVSNTHFIIIDIKL